MDEYGDREKRVVLKDVTGDVSRSAARDRLWRELNNRGDRKVVLFTGGGPGAGKTTAISPETSAEADLVFDSMMIDTKTSASLLREAVNNGWRAEVLYVIRPLEDVARGVIDRGDKGRWNSYASLPDEHVKAQESIVKLAKEFENEPNVSFKGLLNREEASPMELTWEAVDAGGDWSYRKSNEERPTSRAPREQDSKSSDESADGGEH